MGCNAKRFSEIKNVNVRKIKGWYDAGYLGTATRDEKTKVYDIPEDTPIPYKADTRIKKKSKLWTEILKAADLRQAIYPDMYKHIEPSVVTAQIDEFVNAGFITMETTASGAQYLEITLAGHKLMKSLSEPNHKNTLQNVEKYVSIACNLMQAFKIAAPMLADMLQHPAA